MNQFSNGTIPIITESVARAFILNEEERQQYATELLDTYYGFGEKYIIELLNNTIKTKMIKETMQGLIMPFPLLTSFIEDLSMVYKEQPRRKFYLNGKEIISELESDISDKKKYYINAELKGILDNFYNKEFCLRIEGAEELTNLLHTTVFKINNREGELKLDFIPNDIISVTENINDSTQINGIYFLVGIVRNAEEITPSYELWTPEYFEMLEGTQTKKEENRAVIELQKYYNNPDLIHIGSGFPPLIVLRDSLSNTDFWNLKGKGILDVIKQINLAFTEIRYLQRSGSFGLKYVINTKLPTDSPFDLMGVWELEQSSSVPGSGKNEVQIGELKNEARIKELTDSVNEMVKFLFVLVGINTDNLKSSKDAESAESKILDREDIKKFLQKQRKIWALNEENIFKTLITVYNRDNSSKLPQGLILQVDFVEIELTAEQMEKKLSNWLVMIDNNFKTALDWIQEDNPDLTTEEAKKLFGRNKEINLKQTILEDEGNEEERNF